MLNIRETTWNKALYVYLYSVTDFSQGFFNMTGTQLQCAIPQETRLSQLQLKTPTFESSAALGTSLDLGAEHPLRLWNSQAFGGHWPLGHHHNLDGFFLAHAACSPHKANGKELWAEPTHTDSTQGCSTSPWPYLTGKPENAFNAFKFNWYLIMK